MKYTYSFYEQDAWVMTATFAEQSASAAFIQAESLAKVVKADSFALDKTEPYAS